MAHKEKTLRLAEAKAQCLQLLAAPPKTKKITITKAHKRILAVAIVSPINVPAHTNAAMDGYAIKKSDFSQTKALECIDCIYAGKPSKQSLSDGQCMQIMTGGVIPAGADFVVPQEFAKQDNQQVRFLDYQGGANIRQKGEDLTKGGVALKKGRLLTAADLGLLASLGVARVCVYKRLRVAFFSTGDELCRIGETLKSGQIYDSNRYCLSALLANLNVKLTDLGIIKDDPVVLKKALLVASEKNDVIITTGGVSVGQADFVKVVLSEIGQMNFCQLAIKPGRPLTFGNIKRSCFFGLPGNPVAAMVTFYQLVQPILKQLAGQKQHLEPLLIKAQSLFSLSKKLGRREFVRVCLSRQADKLTVQLVGGQGSGVLSSMSKANALVILPEDLKSVNPGDYLDVQPFYGLM